MSEPIELQAHFMVALYLRAPEAAVGHHHFLYHILYVHSIKATKYFGVCLSEYSVLVLQYGMCEVRQMVKYRGSGIIAKGTICS